MRIYLLLLFVLMITRAQATNVIFDRITMDSGLSSSSVTSILKDRTGYVWVGTTEGLNRYDGYTFKVFLPVPDYSRIQMEVSGSFFPRVGLAVMTEVRIHF
jgi:ligand-binding sensor domain-containing protein